jgi:creatinine amidohydrolase
MRVSRRDVVKGALTAALAAGPLAEGVSAMEQGAGPAGTEVSAASGRSRPMDSMRSRYLTTLNNFEISDYLKRSDVLFIPVGTVEMHGVMPVESEYVLPLAFALTMARKVDGLILPHMAYFYPGGTAIG